MRKVLVTGATGFVGSHIIDVLTSRGIAVRCLVRRSSRLTFIGPSPPELAFGDVTRPATLPPALEGIDGIVHCAGLTKACTARDYFRVNEDGSRNLYLAIRSCPGQIRKIVHISSLAALGPSLDGKPVTEESAAHPISDYGRSKLAGQRIAESFMRELPISVVIPPAVYGPRDDDFLVYIKFAAIGITPLFGKDPRYLSLVYAKDLAEAVLVALTSDHSAGRSYLVDDACIYTWESVAEIIDHLTGKPSRRVRLPVIAAKTMGVMGDLYSRLSGKAVLLNSQKVQEILQTAWVCSAQRIRDELGFRATCSLQKGFGETLAWYKKRTPHTFP